MRFMRSRDFSEPSPTTEIVENRREKPHVLALGFNGDFSPQVLVLFGLLLVSLSHSLPMPTPYLTQIHFYSETLILSLSLSVLPLLISISQQKSAGGLREEKSYAFRDRKCWKRDLRVSQSTAFRSFSTQSQEDDEEVCSLHSSMTRSVPNGCDRVGFVRIISV
ncbi:hypothetical protein CK203_020592 [Vitis vinifera]|uniref:Uncharacterized protein n=1 Tax=Vitis vinifera TaxID=29760 RepID=A0A438FMA8_VITVI|nr:hypothetical protein CK203_020592 [Vitis vinifera]